jgi:MoaA/NifB/PqqE/SkfB family radical SAM enzyme
MHSADEASSVVRSLWNRLIRRPLCVSFEVTHSCVADCVHCDKGGVKRETGLMRPDDYRRYSRTLKPGVCQLSGGEPLLRDDLEQIVSAVKRPSGAPFIICVSNAWLLTEERYLGLERAGVSLFSISLDFPDERHDDFRRIPGLFAKMSELVPRLARTHRHRNIVLNSALTHANFRAIPQLVEKAKEWGVPLSFSAYSALRTGDQTLCITDPEDLTLLRRHLDDVKEGRGRAGVVMNSDYVLDRTYRFFAEGGMGGCRAGKRFLVVRPDGLLNACSMFPDLRYRARKETVQGFEPIRKSCDQCYVAIRAGTERPLWRLVSEGLALRSTLR